MILQVGLNPSIAGVRLRESKGVLSGAARSSLIPTA